ncbi:Protein of unknown function [Lactobacillus helveticus CIRM-BIA 103]|nr:Protein of unknown function [Lactobacillus helveticus CIRM-BIA 103]
MGNWIPIVISIISLVVSFIGIRCLPVEYFKRSLVNLE